MCNMKIGKAALIITFFSTYFFTLSAIANDYSFYDCKVINSFSKRILPSESSDYWIKEISNSDLKEEKNRAIFSLFRRHIEIGSKMKDISKILRKLNWLKPFDCNHITLIAGWIPVDRDSKAGSNYVVSLFPKDRENASAIYLSFDKEITWGEFYISIWGFPDSEKICHCSNRSTQQAFWAYQACYKTIFCNSSYIPERYLRLFVFSKSALRFHWNFCRYCWRPKILISDRKSVDTALIEMALCGNSNELRISEENEFNER